MSFTEVISILAIVISLISLFATLYFQYLRSPGIGIFIGESIDIFYLQNYILNLFLDIVLINRGAQPCVVTKIQCHYMNKSQRATFNWFGFYTSSNASSDQLSEGIKKFYKFGRSAEVIPIPGYKITKRKISFSSEKSSKLIDPGTQLIEVLVFTNFRPKKPYTRRIRFTLSQNMLQELEENHVADKNNVIKETFNVHLI